MDITAVADYLGESPLFACLSPSDRVALAGKMRPKHFARDEVVFHNDDPAGHVFLITSGTVKVSIPDEQGHEVVVAQHGKEALRLLDKDEFDLVLMDVQMPDMDGFEAAAMIRAKERGTDAYVPIVAMNAHAM